MMTKFSTGPGAHNSVGVPLDWSGFTLEKLHSPSCSFGITCATRATPPEARFQCHRLATEVQVESLKLNKPRVLRIAIGKVTKVSTTKDPVDQQFLASVSNVNVFQAGNLSIDSLSAVACTVEGDLLPWSSPLWLTIGDGVKKLDLGEDSVCSGKGRYNLGLPVGLDQHQAVGTCQALGHGRMTRASSQDELRAIAKWFQWALPGRCGNIWNRVSQFLTKRGQP